MKTSKKALIIGFVMLAIGVTLVVLGAAVYDDKNWALGWKPNFALFVPGLFVCVISFVPILLGLSPKIVKMGMKLQNEALDTAGTEIQSAMTKTAVFASPAVATIAKSAKEITATGAASDIEKELKKIDDLKSKKMITEAEHKQMRNKILGLDK